jgi:hypothetical protein
MMFTSKIFELLPFCVYVFLFVSKACIVRVGNDYLAAPALKEELMSAMMLETSCANLRLPALVLGSSRA